MLWRHLYLQFPTLTTECRYRWFVLCAHFELFCPKFVMALIQCCTRLTETRSKNISFRLLDFRSKTRFLVKNSIFVQKLDFSVKNSIFGQKIDFRSKTRFFGQKLDFGQNSIFGQKNHGQKLGQKLGSEVQSNRSSIPADLSAT